MWRANLLYVIDTPVPSCDRDARVIYTHDDGRELIRDYSLHEDRFPDHEIIDDFIQSEVARLEAEDEAAALAAAEAEAVEANVAEAE